ncbi:MAG: glutamine--tRNA ligase/YqeY domain fusion protein [Gammaproteobacteria bacterium]|nr:glutamine--tRNA ligase/YqeY domain fusion protein [Gammaproteobacteria bacterium]
MATGSTNFIRHVIDADIAAGRNGGRVVTRFPPEPNGYLHIGHAKSICLNFGIAEDYGGACNLRFDDTNPEKEDIEYADSIKRDVQWLGYEWKELCYASGYFERLHDFAVELIENGKAYVDSLTPEEIRDYRGTLKEPGRESPYRDRSIEENLDLFRRMREGEFGNGEHSLRARIDMASGNINMRDPVIYRIRHAAHWRTGDEWCIYPMYDFTHCLSDAIEGVTHSLCTLEFEDHRPLYDWVLENVDVPCHPQQIEFGRLNLSYTVMSKRLLNRLVQEGHVAGWDDPRLPTITGLRRRGFTPGSIRSFCERIGVTKSDGIVEMGVLEHAVREELDHDAERRMGVLRPLKVVIENYPEDRVEDLVAQNHPKRPEAGERTVPFSREIYIEREDYMDDPPRKYFRLGPGREVRLRYGYYITCREAIRNEAGEITELRCTYDPETRGGTSPDGRKVKGTIHWVSAAHAVEAEVRIYDRLFLSPDPDAADFLDQLNPGSLEVLDNCRLEPDLGNAGVETRYQLERQGYFCVDPDSTGERMVLNRTVTLRDSWARQSG